MPKYDDMSGVSENPITNLNRFRFVEFPIYNIAVYPLYWFFGIDIRYDRLVSILFSLGSIIFLYLICRRYLGTGIALLTAAIYAFLPFNIFFSRTTLPEPTFLFFALGMMHFVDRLIWESRGGVLSFVFTAVAFLIKPWAVFFVPPLFYSLLVKYGSLKKIPKNFIFFAILVLVPFLLWRLWILRFPEGIPASSWLLNGDYIRFRPAFWNWIISQRMGGEILGASGLVFFVVGLLKRAKDNNWFLHIWALSLFLYFVIFATGNVRHNYYQFIFVPVGAVFFTRGFLYLIKGNKEFLPRFWGIILALIFLPLSFYASFLQVREFYKINNPGIVEAGRSADRILPKDAVVVAPLNGDTAFLYQTNRVGFAFAPLPLTQLVSDYGVTHFASVSRDDKTNWVLRHFKILENNPKFVIADLRIIEKPWTADPEP